MVTQGYALYVAGHSVNQPYSAEYVVRSTALLPPHKWYDLLQYYHIFRKMVLTHTVYKTRGRALKSPMVDWSGLGLANVVRVVHSGALYQSSSRMLGER